MAAAAIWTAASDENAASEEAAASAVARLDDAFLMEEKVEVTRHSPSAITVDVAGASSRDPGKICWPSFPRWPYAST